MIVSIHQPAYLPWLGHFARVASSDIHIVLDHVQFEKNSFINRNKIKTAQGSSWLTVPVKTKGKFGDLAIQDIEISNDMPWSHKHWEGLRLNYSKAPHFQAHEAFFKSVYSKSWTHLNPLVQETTGYLLNAFEIKTPIHSSSEMKVPGAKDELVFNLCKEVGATVYLSGPLGRDYLNEELFQNAGIEVRYHDYVHPVYEQTHEGFQPNLSAIDLLFNCGEESGAILRGA